MSSLEKADCPTEAALLAHLAGLVPPPGMPALTLHLDQCVECQRTIAAAVRSSTSSTQNLADGPRVLTPGEVLGGRYLIGRFLGRGGMGEVYEAEDNVLSEKVALKTVTSTRLDDIATLRRIKAEVQLARRVTHVNVCRILEFGTYVVPTKPDEVLPFLTMELLSGETLASRLTRGALLELEARVVIESIAHGLHAAHQAGVVHRDLKCENVFLVGNLSRVVVMDFGLAKAQALGQTFSSFSSDHRLIGTPGYMAPEQVEGREVTPKADVYSLGVVAFELLTRRLPFTGSSPIGLAAARLHERPMLLHEVSANIDPFWQSFVSACLERKPDSRPDIATLLIMLNRRTHKGGDADVKQTSKRDRFAWISAAAASVGLATAVVAYSYHREQPTVHSSTTASSVIAKSEPALQAKPEVAVIIAPVAPDQAAPANAKNAAKTNNRPLPRIAVQRRVHLAEPEAVAETTVTLQRKEEDPFTPRATKRAPHRDDTLDPFSQESPPK